MAAQFEYILAVYDARFKYELQLYYYDRMVYAVNIINFKTIMQEQEEEEEEDIHELTEEFKIRILLMSLAIMKNFKRIRRV